MKSKQLFTKMLLVALCLIGGSGFAWAQTTAFSQDFTDKNPSSTNVEDYGFTASTSTDCTATVENGQLKLYVVSNSSSDVNSTATATFTAVGTGNVITFSCSWIPGGPTGTRPYSHLRLTDADGKAALSLTNNGQTKTLFINGNESVTAASGNDWRSTSVVWNIVATLNMSTKKIESLTVTKSGESTPVVNLADIAFQNEVTSISKFVYQTTQKSSYDVTSYLDNVSITYVDADPVANVTFKYEDNDGNSLSSLKADVVDTYTVGDAISGLISSSLTSSFKNGDESIRYDYNTYTVSDDATSVPAGGATVTLKFTPKAKYNYTVNAVQNEDKTKTIKQLASGYVYAGDAVTIPYPHYFNVNGTLYTRGVTNKEYRKSITPSSDGHVEQFPYNASENVNIVYLSEGEDIEGATSSTSSNIPVRASNAVAATHSGNLTITQLQAGTYKITAGLFQTSSANTTAKFTIGDNVISLATTNVNLNEKTSDEFTIASAQDVVWDGGSALDYIYIQQIFTDADLAIAAGKDTKFLAVGDIWTIAKDTEFTTSSTGTVTLTSSNPTVATVEGMTVTTVGGGTTTITINQARDNTYEASSVAITLTVLYDQTNVTGAETWDWTKTTSGTAYMVLTNETTPAKDTEFVLKNVEIYGKSGAAYTIPTGFGDAQKLSVKGQYPFRYNSGGMFQGNTVKFTTEVPGVLAVDFSHTGSSSTSSRTLYINGVATSFTTENTTTVNATGIVVPAGDIEITGNQEGSLAYLRIYKITFTPTAVKATINPTYGMATFSSTYALDFTGITTLTAYQATACDGEKVTLEPVTGVVAANTGLLISGETTNIPISSEAGTSYADPDCHFFACNGSFTEVGTPESGTNFVLSVQGGKVVFAPIGSTPAPIKAGQAALWANFTPNASRTLHISFGDDATDIRLIENGKMENSVYDLQGRRVSQPTKGLYIKDGKVVVVK